MEFLVPTPARDDVIGGGRDAPTLDGDPTGVEPDDIDPAALAGLDPELEFVVETHDGEEATVVHTVAPDGSVSIEVKSRTRTELALTVDPRGARDLGDIVLLLSLAALIAALRPGEPPTDLCLAGWSGPEEPNDPDGYDDAVCRDAPGMDLTLDLTVQWRSGREELSRRIRISEDQSLLATETGRASFDDDAAAEATRLDSFGQDAIDGLDAGEPCAFDQPAETDVTAYAADIAVGFAAGRIDIDLSAVDIADASYLPGSAGLTRPAFAPAEGDRRNDAGGPGPINPSRLLQAFAALRLLRGSTVYIALESVIREPASASLAFRWARGRGADGL